MSTRSQYDVSAAAKVAYRRTLLQLQEVAAQFPSWDAMLDEERQVNLPSSRACTVRVTAPERNLLDTWLLATVDSASCAANDDIHCSDEVNPHQWTAFMLLWISLRLAQLVGTSDTSSASIWLSTLREVGAYQTCLSFLASSTVDPNQALRLDERLRHLRQRCSAALSRLSGAAEAAATALDDGNGATSSEDAYTSASHTICRASTRAAQSVARDYLRISWDLLNPKLLSSAVDDRLTCLAVNRRDPSATCGAKEASPAALPSTDGKAVFPTCVREVADCTARAVEEQMRARCGKPRVWIRAARIALCQIGYNVVVKTRSKQIDHCYFLLPLLADFEAAVLACEAAEHGQLGSGLVDQSIRSDDQALGDQACRTLAALLETTQDFYEASIDRLLAGYRESCVSPATPPRVVVASAAANPLAPPPPLTAKETLPATSHPRTLPSSVPLSSPEGSSAAGTRELTLSQAAYALLVEVVEPTCSILRRHSKVPLPHRSKRTRLATPLAESSGAGKTEVAEGAERHEVRDVAGTENAAAPTTHTASLFARPFEQPVVLSIFVECLREKLQTCFAHALRRTKGKSASAAAHEQAGMDSYLVQTYLSCSLHSEQVSNGLPS